MRATFFVAEPETPGPELGSILAMQTGPLLAVALLGGFAAGSVGGMLFSPAGPADGQDPLLIEAAGGASDGDLVDKYRALEAQHAALQASFDSLELTVEGLANRREAVIEAAPSTDVEADTSAYADREAMPYTLEEEMRFAAYLENLEKKKEEEEQLERERRRQEQMVRRVDRLAEQLGLDAYQKGEMQRVLSESEATTREYFAKLRESGEWDRDAVRTGMEELNQKTNDQLAGFLTPDQLTQYQESNTGFNRFFGGGGRGGDSPRSGGNTGGQRGGFNNLGGGGRGGF